MIFCGLALLMSPGSLSQIACSLNLFLYLLIHWDIYASIKTNDSYGITENH